MDQATHFTRAPDDLQKAYGAAMTAARDATAKDDLGRVDWAAINAKMADWWAEKGYKFP
ncbi:MAG: hypothetical protein ACPGO3_06545 [Magnetospiraceae bacterium]